MKMDLSPEVKVFLEKTEEEHEEYLNNYTPNFSVLGFDEENLVKPSKFIPSKEYHQDEAIEINKADFNPREFMDNTVDNVGNIKNGEALFMDYFLKKISPIVGVETAEYYLDSNSFITWKAQEMQNDLCEYINTIDKNKSDMDKIIAIKMIDDLIPYQISDDDADLYLDSFVPNSLLFKYKNTNSTILEKYFTKEIIYKIFNLEQDKPGRYSVSAKYRKEEGDFLEKEIGDKFYPENYHNNKFNNFEFRFTDTQLESIKSAMFYGDFMVDGEVKFINYYKFNKIKRPDIYEIDKNKIVGYVNECYVTTYLSPDILGIYSVDGRLVGWKNLFDLKEKEINQVNDLFEIKKDHCVKKEDMALFRVSSSLGFRDYIQKTLSIDLSKISLNNQFYFLNFIQGKTEAELIGFKDFISKSIDEKDKNNKFRTFLSIEQGGKEMGDKILTLGEKLPESSNVVLFKTYGEIIDASEEVGEILKNKLKEKVSIEMVEKAKESLLSNGKNLLDKYSEKAKMCDGTNCEEIGRELEERLSLAKKSVFAFSAVCKVLAENGEFSFEDFEKAKLTYDQSPVYEEMKNKIIKMHHENTKQYPDKLRDEWRGTLKEGLENPDPNQLIVSASYDGEIVSTMRVIKKEDGSWYGASFNVNPTIQGGRIGSELLKEVLKDLARNKPFVADCYSGNPMLSTYLNKFGFKITKELENYHDTGELVYEITLSPEEKKGI